jgi:hypothetical protein
MAAGQGADGRADFLLYSRIIPAGRRRVIDDFDIR